MYIHYKLYLTLPHFRACPKPDLDFQYYIWWSFCAQSFRGATVTGARNFLIAYNVNILSTKEQAHRVALNIREQGRGEEQVSRSHFKSSQIIVV
jgi:hypothetical protein